MIPLPAAYVPYCSSDCYTGTRNASALTHDFTFHGKYIIEAVIADLLINTWMYEAQEVFALDIIMIVMVVQW